MSLAPVRPNDAPTRTGIIYTIADLIHRYEAQLDGAGKWRVRDKHTNVYTPQEYAEESLARAAERLLAACDILALFDGPAT